MKNITIIILLLIFLIGCNSNNSENTTENETSAAENISVELSSKQIEIVGVKMGLLQQRNLKTAVKANGFLELPPQNKASISSIYGGTVERIYIKQGEFVQKGAVLAEMKSPDFIQKQRNYLEALNGYIFIEKEYTRKEKLLKGDAASVKEFQALEMGYKNLKVKLNSLKLEMKLYGIDVSKLSVDNILPVFPITTPIQGYIGLINTNIGAFAEPQKEIFEIFDTRFINVVLIVYENDLNKVQKGQLVQFSLNNNPEKTFEAIIFSVEKSYDKNMHAVRAHASLKNPNQTLIPGMYVSARIIVDDYKAWSMPENSIIREGDKSYIFSVTENVSNDDNKIVFNKVQVITGAFDNGYEEVKPIERLQEKVKIVTSGAYFINAELIKQSGGQDDD